MNDIKVIKEQIHEPSTLSAISRALGKPTTSPEVAKYITGAMLEIMRNKDLRTCSISSIINSLIECATVGLAVDNRKLAYLVPFKNQVVLMPGYQGYIYKIKQADPSANITVNLVFKDDKFTTWNESGIAKYNHEIADPFNDKIVDLIGAYCYINTDTSASIEILNKAELMKIKSKSRMESGIVWREWELEMIKKSVVRRAGKRNFISSISKLDALDNRFFELKKEKPEQVTIAETLPLPEIETDERQVGDVREEKEADETDNIGIRTASGLVTASFPPVRGNGYHKFGLSDFDGFFQTKNKDFVEMLLEAKKAEKKVELTYTQTKVGKYVNNTIETVS